MSSFLSLFPVLVWLLSNLLSIARATNLPSLSSVHQPRTSSSISTPIHSYRTDANMSTMETQQVPTVTDASVLRELKETIQIQKQVIETLKTSLATALHTNQQGIKSSTAATTATAGGHHHHGVSSSSDDEVLGKYLTAPFYQLALRRVGWLSFFLVSLSLTAVIMNGFEHTLSQQIELAYFVPLLAGHGGNTGGQTVGTVLSALSTGAITTRDAMRVITKEAASGMMVGLLLGSVVGIVAHFVGGISLHVAAVVFCTLPVLSTIAATLGSSIPFVCKAVGLDPAVIAAPAMTTFVDVSGLLSYFLIANQVFKFFGLKL